MPPGRTAPAYGAPEEEILLPPPDNYVPGSTYVPPANAAPPPLPADPAAAPPPVAPSGGYATEPQGGNDVLYTYDSPTPPGPYRISDPAATAEPYQALPPPNAQPQYGELLNQPWADPTLPGSGASSPLLPEVTGARPTTQPTPMGQPRYNFGAAEPYGNSQYAIDRNGATLGSQQAYNPPPLAQRNAPAGGALTPPAGQSSLLADYYNGAASHARSMKVAPKPKKWSKGDYEIAGRMLLGMGIQGANGMSGSYGSGVAGQQSQYPELLNQPWADPSLPGSGASSPLVPGPGSTFDGVGSTLSSLAWGGPTIDPSLHGQSMQNEDPGNPAWRPTQTGPTLQDQLLTLGGQAVQGAASGLAGQNDAFAKAQSQWGAQQEHSAQQRIEAGRQAGGAPGGLSLPSFSSGLAGPGGAGSGIPGLPPVPTYTPPGPGGSGGTSRPAGGTMGPGGIGSGSGGYVRPYIPGASLPPLPTSTPSTPRTESPSRGTSVTNINNVPRDFSPGSREGYGAADSRLRDAGSIDARGNLTTKGQSELSELGWIDPATGTWTAAAAQAGAVPQEAVGQAGQGIWLRSPDLWAGAGAQQPAAPASDAGQPLDPNAVLPVTPAEVAAVEGTGSYNSGGGGYSSGGGRSRSSYGGSGGGGGYSGGGYSRSSSYGGRSRSSGSYGSDSDSGDDWESFLKDFDGDGDMDSKDEMRARSIAAKRGKKTRRGKRGGRSAVNFQTTPMREEILSTIEKSRNKK